LGLFDFIETFLGGVELSLESVNEGPEVLVLCLEGVDSSDECGVCNRGGGGGGGWGGQPMNGWVVVV
jgi:hypothetical protein